jgi:hypothetical protein
MTCIPLTSGAPKNGGTDNPDNPAYAPPGAERGACDRNSAPSAATGLPQRESLSRGGTTHPAHQRGVQERRDKKLCA